MTTTRVYVGIDPGLSGAIGWVTHDGHADAQLLPLTTAREIDAEALRLQLEILRPEFVVIELVGGRPGNGSVASFNFGMAYGAAIVSTISARCLYARVRPQAWQKAILGPSVAKGETKAAAISYVKQAFPSVSLVPKGCRVENHNLADAVCLAEYARRCRRAAPW